jgi:hypothetical protein
LKAVIPGFSEGGRIILMAVAHIRVLEVRTLERMQKLVLYMETRSSTSVQESGVTGNIHMKCSRHWHFSIPSQMSECLSLTLKKRRFFGANRRVAQCALPLDWFPTNRVVREWFPMTLGQYQMGAEVPVMILMDIHIDTRSAKAFRAAFANLRVVPNWPRPDNGRNSPAPPQVVYVVPEHDNGGVRYRPVGSDQYPSPQVVHQIQTAPRPDYAVYAGRAVALPSGAQESASLYPTVPVIASPQ